MGPRGAGETPGAVWGRDPARTTGFPARGEERPPAPSANPRLPGGPPAQPRGRTGTSLRRDPGARARPCRELRCPGPPGQGPRARRRGRAQVSGAASCLRAIKAAAPAAGSAVPLPLPGRAPTPRDKMQCSLWALACGALALAGAVGPADPLVLSLDATPEPDAAPVPDAALDVAHVAALDTALGLRLFQAMVAAAPGNAVLSPPGAAALLRALQLVARGPGQAQLRAAAGYAPHEPGVGQLDVALGGAGVALAAGVFVQRDLPLAPSATVLTPLLQRVNFRHPPSARSAINAWARTHTHGRIRELVGAGVLAGGAARLVLANTVHVRSAWARPFDPRATRPRPFHVPHRPPTLVPTMAQAGHFLHGEFVTAEGLEYEVVELPYASGGLSLLLAVPLVRNAPLAPLVRTLSASLIRAWTRALTPRPRLLLLPRFSLEAECDLRTPLRALGIRDVFNPRAADLSGLTFEEPLFVSQALHKVKFEVMEGGTEAAAGTAAVVLARMAPLELALDRPFLFVLRHNPTGATLFVGQVLDP